VLDGMDPLHEVSGPMGVPGEQLLPDGLQLEQDFPEPQLVCLVQDDEQQLVVGGRVGQEALERQELRKP
jgi:hypothetical protein